MYGYIKTRLGWLAGSPQAATTYLLAGSSIVLTACTYCTELPSGTPAAPIENTV